MGKSLFKTGYFLNELQNQTEKKVEIASNKNGQ